MTVGGKALMSLVAFALGVDDSWSGCMALAYSERGSQYRNHLDCSILLACHTYGVDRDGGELGADITWLANLSPAFTLSNLPGTRRELGHALGAQVLCGLKLRTASRQFDEQAVVYLQAADKRSEVDSVGRGL